MTPFRRSLPVTLTSFINKSGTIGLSIIPIILVERQISTDQSAWIVGAIRVAGLVGILLGGWSCDVLGLRRTLLLSFAICGLGLAPLPFFKPVLVLAALGCLAQLGTSLYYSSARLLITQVVPLEERREAIAWQRTANNLAQIISYTLGALLSRFGTSLLILFDALTSFIATGVGAKILPDAPASIGTGPASKVGSSANSGAGASSYPGAKSDAEAFAPAARSSALSNSVLASAAEPTPGRSLFKVRRDFYHCALVIASFSFLYDFYEVGAAARCKILFGADGLAVFSELMVINTVLCAALSVVAAKKMQNAADTLPLGLLLLILGLTVTFMGDQSRGYFFAGSFVMTLGEIVFNSLAAVVLIHFTPPGKRQGTIYSTGVFVQSMGRISGAALAFPCLIGSAHPLYFVGLASAPAMLVCLASRPLLRKLEG